jgi:hypothetical protein
LTKVENIEGRYKGSAYYPVLVEVLIYMNFNSRDFKDYLADFIGNEINGLECLPQKIERILFHLKEISQLQEMSGMGLQAEVSSVKEVIRDWLRREVLFLKNKQRLGTAMPEDGDVEGEHKESSLPNDENLDYDLTVEELGLYKRVIKDGKILKNKKVMPMLRGVARTVRTKHQSDVALTSLYNSFYTIKEATADSLYDKLMGVMNVLQKIRAGLR